MPIYIYVIENLQETLDGSVAPIDESLVDTIRDLVYDDWRVKTRVETRLAKLQTLRTLVSAF